MNEERAFALMMDALDGVLDDSDSAELDQYLNHHPNMAAEWDSLQTIDHLFRASPPASVPVNFTERTLARLPNPRARRIFMSMFFILLFLGGLVPILLGVFTFAQGGFDAIGGNLNGGFQVIQVLIIGLSSALRSLISNQPIVYAWLATMLLSILIWAQTYRNAMLQPIPVPVRA